MCLVGQPRPTHTYDGTGCATKFRDASVAAQCDGGNAAEYVKKSSNAFQDATGRITQTHWVENTETGIRYEHKTNFSWPRSLS